MGNQKDIRHEWRIKNIWWWLSLWSQIRPPFGRIRCMLPFICVCIFMCAHFLFHSICLTLREIWLHLIRMRFCQHYSSNGPNPLAKKSVCRQDSVLRWPKKRFESANALLSDETSLSESKNHIFVVPESQIFIFTATWNLNEAWIE